MADATLIGDTDTYVSLGILASVVVIAVQVTRLLGVLKGAWSYRQQLHWAGELRRLNQDQIVIPDPRLSREIERDP